MNTQTPSERFLAILAEQLRALGAKDADDIVREMRSHIAETLAQSAAAEAETLAALGDPRELAAALLAERQDASREEGVRPASAARRAFSWLADVASATWPLALGWPLALAVGASLPASPDPVGFAMLLIAQPAGAIVVLTALALVVWPVVALVRTARRRRRGLPTLGTRASKLSAGRSSNSAGWVWAVEGGHALPPVPHPVRARVALAFVLAAIVVGIVWLPTLALFSWKQSETQSAQDHTNDLRMQSYQASAEGWTRDIYTAALSGKMPALVGRGDKGFTASDAVLLGLAASVKADGVSDWRLDLADSQAVTLSGGSANVAVPVVESLPTGGRRVVLHFHVVDPRFGTVKPDEAWSLTGIDREPGVGFAK
jgi:uncharacterized membrane protein